MLTQHYKMELTPQQVEAGASAGNRIHDDHDRNIGLYDPTTRDCNLVGFVDFVSDSHFTVILFEPMDIPEEYMDKWNITHISDNVDCLARLHEICEENDQMNTLWGFIFDADEQYTARLEQEEAQSQTQH